MENSIAQELASMNILSGVDDINYKKIKTTSNVSSNNIVDIKNEEKWWETIHTMD